MYYFSFSCFLMFHLVNHLSFLGDDAVDSQPSHPEFSAVLISMFVSSRSFSSLPSFIGNVDPVPYSEVPFYGSLVVIVSLGLPGRC